MACTETKEKAVSKENDLREKKHKKDTDTINKTKNRK